MDSAFLWVVANGMCTETSYPYVAGDGHCNGAKTSARQCRRFECISHPASLTVAGLRPVPELPFCGCHHWCRM